MAIAFPLGDSPTRPSDLPDSATLLQAPRFVDPRAFYLSWPRAGSVLEDGTGVTVEGLADQVFRLPAPLAPGARLQVTLSRWFWACPEGDVATFKARREAERKAVTEAAEAERKAHWRRAREEAKAFNATLRVPVRWTSGYEAVLSGLTERSSGDGQFKRTVYHIVLLEPLAEGRLRRGAGDYLCGYRGKRWIDALDRRDGEADRITCRACLRIATRMGARVDQGAEMPAGGTDNRDCL
jgi:hypothetical protein